MFQEKPEPELLALRLLHNWKPTHSQLQAGDRVLGFAACLQDAPQDCPRASKIWAGVLS